MGGDLKDFKQGVNDQICAFKGNFSKKVWKKVNCRGGRRGGRDQEILKNSK